MATNLNMPSMSEYNKNITTAKIKLCVIDQADLKRGDEYKKAFPFEREGSNFPRMLEGVDESVNYVNIPPLTEKTNKWLDMTLKKMASFTKVNDFVVNLANAMDMNADTFKVALSNTDPTSGTDVVTDGNGVLANITEISYTNYQQEH